MNFFFSFFFSYALPIWILGRPKHYWHEHVKGYHGRNLGITNSDGPRWTEQRRFALKQLRDLGFGRKSLDSVMVHEVDQVIDRFLETKDGIVQMKGSDFIQNLNSTR